MIFKIITNNTGVSNNNQFMLPLVSTGTYDFEVDWGDDTTDTITSYEDDITHTYSVEGEYTITLTGDIDGLSFHDGDKLKITEISSWQNISLNSGTFSGCTNLDVVATDTPTLSGSLMDLFNGCTSLTNLDASGWDISSVTNIIRMFYNCSSLQSQDLSGWDFSSITQGSLFMKGASPLSQAHYDALLVSLGTQTLNDDVSIHFSTSTHSTDPPRLDGDLSFGAVSATNSTQQSFFNGNMSKCAYFSSLLYSDEISDLYNNGNGIVRAEYSPSLSTKVVNSWNMNETVGLYDSTGSNHGAMTPSDLSITGGPENSTVLDSVGTNNGSLINIDTEDISVSPVNKFALNLNGTDSRVTIDALEPSSDWCFAFWVSLDSYPVSLATILGDHSNTEANGIFINDSGQLVIRLQGSYGTVISQSTINLNEWNFIVIQRSGMNIDLYINGVLDHDPHDTYEGGYPATGKYALLSKGWDITDGGVA